MSEVRCPGGNHPNLSGDLCCDACWRRVPIRINARPRPWRSELRTCRSIHAWGRVEDILISVRDWLQANQR